MCPIRDNCSFYSKFGKLQHEKLQRMITAYCAADQGHEQCVHFIAQSLFALELDGHICPTCLVIPRSPHC